MQKLRCPHCGVVNLEKFITYPQCAGCGNTLPQQSTPETVPFWRRPVKPIAWVSLMGVTLIGLIWAASVFQTGPESVAQVALYGDTSRRTTVGEIFTLNLRVNALAESRLEQVRPLRKVRLRIPLRVFRSLRFVSIKPQADKMEIVGNGRYFEYETLERDASIRLELRVVKPGRIRVPMTVYAENYLPNDWRVNVISTSAVTNRTN